MLRLKMAAGLAGTIVFGALLAGEAWCATPVSPAALPHGPGSLAGIWAVDGYKSTVKFGSRELIQRTESGELPPLKPWAADLLEQRISDADAGHPYATTKSQCLPAGVPQVMFGPGALPFQFIETPGQMTILIEEFGNFRIIRMNAKHQEDPDPSFMGDSIGHWEGDTLVVDTIGLTDRTTIDQVGMPHSDALHVVERFRRVSQDYIDLVVTIDDPKTFTRTWTAETAFKAVTQGRIEEDVCENNRNPVDANGRSTIQLQSSP
jgi:hypothetical protein